MKEGKENSEEEATRGGQDAFETVVRGTRFQRVSSAWGPARPGHGSSSHKTRRDLSSFSSFVTSHLQQNRADERERGRERDLSTSAGFYPKYPHEKRDLGRQRGRSSLFSMDPHNRRGSASFSTFFTRIQPGSSSNDRDLPILEFDVSICSFDFEGTPFTTWNVSIHKLRHRVSKSPGSPRVDSFFFWNILQDVIWIFRRK